MEQEIAAADLMRLLGVNKASLVDLAKKGIAVRGKKRGAYRLDSVTSYRQHIRDQAAGRGGETGAAVRERLASAQAELISEKVKAMRGETLPTAEVEALWMGKLRTFRNRILAIGDRLRHLPARDHVRLVAELRAALSELSEGQTQETARGCYKSGQT